MSAISRPRPEVTSGDVRDLVRLSVVATDSGESALIVKVPQRNCKRHVGGRILAVIVLIIDLRQGIGLRDKRSQPGVANRSRIREASMLH